MFVSYSHLSYIYGPSNLEALASSKLVVVGTDVILRPLLNRLGSVFKEEIKVLGGNDGVNNVQRFQFGDVKELENQDALDGYQCVIYVDKNVKVSIQKVVIFDSS